MAPSTLATTAICLIATVSATSLAPLRRGSSDCPGYVASEVQHAGSSMSASLSLASHACNLYGTDLSDLKLAVDYQTSKCHHNTRHHYTISTNTIQSKGYMSRFMMQPSRSIKSPTRSCPGQRPTKLHKRTPICSFL